MENVYRRMILVLEWSVLVFMMKTIILEIFGICKYSLYFFTLKVHLFMQGIDKTNKSIPYIQRETYWCVF